MSSESGSFEGDTLTLNDVPLVVYFSDRPNRIAGHMSLESFVESWGKGPNSFKSDPPNATLSIMDEAGDKNIVVELSHPEVKSEGIQYHVRILSGELPASFKTCSLFVDILGSSPAFADAMRSQSDTIASSLSSLNHVSDSQRHGS